MNKSEVILPGVGGKSRIVLEHDVQRDAKAGIKTINLVTFSLGSKKSQIYTSARVHEEKNCQVGLAPQA